MNYADELLRDGCRNDINHKNTYTRRMRCINRAPYDQYVSRFRANAMKESTNGVMPCPSIVAFDKENILNLAGLKDEELKTQLSAIKDGMVDMEVIEDGIWTTIICPVCGATDFWSIGDGDELF